MDQGSEVIGETSHRFEGAVVFEDIEDKGIGFGRGEFIVEKGVEKRFDIFPLFESFELFWGGVFEHLIEGFVHGWKEDVEPRIGV